MKDLLFGWLLKNKFEVTGLEDMIGAIEIIIIIFIIFGIIELIKFIIDKIKGEK